MSNVILGAMSFGNPSPTMGWTLPEAQALPILKHAFDTGINTWDTVCFAPTISKFSSGFFVLELIMLADLSYI